MTEQRHDAGSTRRQFLKASATGAAATAIPGVAHAIEKVVSGSPEVEKQFTPLRATDQISRWAENLKPALAVPTEPNAVRAWRPRARETLGRLLALDEAATAQEAATFGSRQASGSPSASLLLLLRMQLVPDARAADAAAAPRLWRQLP